MSRPPINMIRRSNGRVSAVCEFCGRVSAAQPAASDGEPDLFRLGRGWSQGPYPADFQHRDGSYGSTHTCPACNKRLHAGESLRCRPHLTA